MWVGFPGRYAPRRAGGRSDQHGANAATHDRVARRGGMLGSARRGCVPVGNDAGGSDANGLAGSRFGAAASHRRRTTRARHDRLDGDDKLDLATAHSTTAWVSVWLRRSAGGVRPRVDYPIGTGDQAIAIVDANGYGKLDLILDDSEQTTQ
jgi:hypothetical protein